ncbi:MAG TPA: hypothetical protein VKF59_16940 [Candidatus Dormibacteraeota bacterium]|nr:hypothetical protein [Candidatus Dormibacteraeota bacterium]
MAGQADFTPDEWVTMRRAMTSAGYIVAWSEGGGAEMLSEILAVTQRISGAGRNHPNQLVRELAAMANVQTGMRPGMRRSQYEEESLAAIRTATALVTTKAPGDLRAFRAFVVELAEAAANAHVEGGLGGFGGVRVTPAEAAAIGRVKKALGLA